MSVVADRTVSRLPIGVLRLGYLKNSRLFISSLTTLNGIRLVAVDLADDDLALVGELLLVERGVAHRVAHEPHRDGENSASSS